MNTDTLVASADAMVRHLAFQLYHSSCPVTIAELHADGTTAVWHLARRWRGGASFAPAAWRAARFAMLARRRFGWGARATDRSTSNILPPWANVPLEYVAGPAAPERSESDEMEALALERWGQWALEQMTDKQAECVRLYMWDGLSTDQISRELRIDKSSVMRHIRRAVVRVARASGRKVEHVSLAALRPTRNREAPMKRVACAVALVLALVAPSHAVTISGTAPTMGNVTNACPPVELIPKTGPVSIHVWMEQGTTIVWRDSVQTTMGAAWALTKPDPAEGTYTIRVRGRRPGTVYGCDTSATLVIAACPPGPTPFVVR